MTHGSGNIEAEVRGRARLQWQKKLKVVQRNLRRAEARTREGRESKLVIVIGLLIAGIVYGVPYFLFGVIWLIAAVVTAARALEGYTCRERQSLSCSRGRQ